MICSGTIACIAVVAILLFASREAYGAINLHNVTAGCDDSAGRDCGHGMCVNGSCVCEDMWSTNADFMDLEECVTSLFGIYVLWSINILALLFCFYKSAGVVIFRVQTFVEARRSAKRPKSICANKSLLAVCAYFIICAPCHLAIAILHLVEPTTRIGFDVLPTMLFFGGKIGLYLCALLIQVGMFGSMIKGISKQQELLIRQNKVSQLVILFVTIIVGSFAFITLTNFQQDVVGQVRIMQAYYVGESMALVIAIISGLVIIRTVNKTFDKLKAITRANNKGADVRKKLVALQSTATKHAGVQALVYLLLGVIPFFINKHQYFLPMSWLPLPFIAIQLSHQFVSDRTAPLLFNRFFGWTSSGARETTAEQQGTSGGKSGGGTVHNIMTIHVNNQDSHPSYSSHQSSFFSNEAIEELVDPQHPLHRRFVAFVDEHYAGNELALFMATVQFKNALTEKDRARIGTFALKEFLLDDSPRAVDVPCELREAFLKAAENSDWNDEAFSLIRRVLMFDLKGNFLVKFEMQILREKKLLGKADPKKQAAVKE